MTVEDEADALYRDAAPIAVHVAKEIEALSLSAHAQDVDAFSGIISCIVFETVMRSIALSMYPIGSRNGEIWIATMYNEAREDALARWARDRSSYENH